MWPTGEKPPSSLPALVSCWWLFYRFAFENWKGRKTLKRVNDEVNTVGQSMAERKVKQPRKLVARNAIMKVVFPKWTSQLSPIFLSELQYFSPILIPLRCVSPYRTHLFEQLCRPEKGLGPELLRCFLLDFFFVGLPQKAQSIFAFWPIATFFAASFCRPFGSAWVRKTWL